MHVLLRNCFDILSSLPATKSLLTCLPKLQDLAGVLEYCNKISGLLDPHSMARGSCTALICQCM